MIVQRQGRRNCDRGCFAATSPPASCRCICGGNNHGIGVEAARARRKELIRERAQAQLAGLEGKAS